MRSPRLLWQLAASYAAIAPASMICIGWLAAHLSERVYLQAVEDHLRTSARLLAEQLPEPIGPAHKASLTAACRQFSRSTGYRVTLVLASGEVLVDTHERPELMDNHASRPEIAAALSGSEASSERYSSSVRQQMAYFAIPLRADSRIVGALRTSVPSSQMTQVLHRMQFGLAAAGMGIAGGVVILGLVLSRRIVRPLAEIRRGAEHFARGDLRYKVPVAQADELAGAAEALNVMAHRLEERIQNTVRQNTEQEAVLASMVEGVLAVDTDQRVISLNQAAAELLASSQSDAQGRNLQEVIRNAELRRFVTSALNGDGPVEGDVVLSSGHDRVLQAHGTALRDAHGQAIGAVIVLNDITRLRRLENLRRDFVANVSHELKTPITSIKGFVETLLDGALKDPEDAERFLRIIAKQADRLNAIIEDLLSLSKIEQGEQSGEIVLAPNDVKQVLEEAILEIQPRAAERQIRLRLTCPDDLRAEINPPLLEEAVLNLLDNALKYSEANSEIHVAAEQTVDEVNIRVRDQGCGVSAEHLPRLFERFYRVDKARSRKLGGTGLGLAIVKHIVQAHHGQVTVESTPGKGSTFTIHLPR